MSDTPQDAPEIIIATLATKIANTVADDDTMSTSGKFIALMMAAAGLMECIEEDFEAGLYNDFADNQNLDLDDFLEVLQDHGQALWIRAKASMTTEMKVDPDTFLDDIWKILQAR